MEAYGGRRCQSFSHRRTTGELSESRCAGGSVDGFDQGEAAAAFAAVADWLGIVGDGLEEVFEDGFVAADVGYCCGGGALIGVAGGEGRKVGRRIGQVGGGDAIVFEDYGALGAGDFEAAWVAGIGGGGGEKRSDRAAGEFESGDGGVFGFDFVEDGGGAGLDTGYVAEKMEEEIDGVDGLVDECATAVEGEGAAPIRVAVIVGRAIPLYASIDQERFAEEAAV